MIKISKIKIGSPDLKIIDKTGKIFDKMPYELINHMC